MRVHDRQLKREPGTASLRCERGLRSTVSTWGREPKPGPSFRDHQLFFEFGNMLHQVVVIALEVAQAIKKLAQQQQAATHHHDEDQGQRGIEVGMEAAVGFLDAGAVGRANGDDLEEDAAQ